MTEKAKCNKTGIGIGIIGLGGRGRLHLSTLLAMNDVEVPAICDLSEERIEMGMELIKASDSKKGERYKDYKELLSRDDIDGVMIATRTSQFEIAIEAMKAGKYVGIEVGGSSSIYECWELVKTSEKTGVPCMLLENCCYGRDEMAILNMVKKGIFGSLSHCQCGYEHYIGGQLWGDKFKNTIPGLFVERNCDTYPTHGLGPIAKMLDINKGNRFMSLTSMASRTAGLNEWAKDNLGKDHPMSNIKFYKGDVVATLIKCARGETILIVNDTILPRPYSRNNRVQGTKGIWMEDNNSIYIEGKSPEEKWEPFDGYRETYEHPLWKEYQILMEEDRKNRYITVGHGGMDYLIVRSFVESVKKGDAPPIDVYDAATWRVVTVLSEQSIALGSAPVTFPDFTNGGWMNRNSKNIGRYTLDDIYEDLYCKKTIIQPTNEKLV